MSALPHTGPEVPPLSLHDAYREMLVIRRFEERLLELHGTAVVGSIHPATGQEAVAVGGRSALRQTDRVVATYRGHHWAIACGLPLESLFAEIAGRGSGINGGRAGSAFLTGWEYGFAGENSIVGAGLPIAGGLALAAQARCDERVVAVSFGDGATNQGAAHEALVFAVGRSLPVVFICENNAWSEMTPIAQVVPVELAGRAAAYGMPADAVDGNDPVAVAFAVGAAADRARRGEGPTFIECRTNRLGAHYHADVEHYRPKEDREAASADDPLMRLRSKLLESGHAEAELAAVEAEVRDKVAVAERDALAAPPADSRTSQGYVYRDAPRGKPTTIATTGAVLTYAEAVNAALERELADRPEILLFGEDIAVPGGTFGVTKNLRKRFGEERVFDTPITEAAILGAAVGAAMEGLRPVVEIMFGDFLLVALDQLVNQAANVSYASRGAVAGALVVRTQQAVTPGACAQHSQSLEALIAHVPGLRVGVPATPQDAYAMTRAAIASNDPCVLFESRALYQLKGRVALDAPVEELGGARIVREGSDVLIVSWGRMVDEAQTAADELTGHGVSAAVLDLRWLNPPDRETLIALVRATSRLLVVHEANLTGGFGGEVLAIVAEECLFDLDAAPRRLALPDVRIPAAPTLQQALLPSAQTIVDAVRGLVSA